MAAPTAPMPLSRQVKKGTNIVVTVVLRGLGAPPTFFDGGTTFNSGDPTATYTIATGTNPNAWELICDTLDDMACNGTAVVT